MSDFENISKSSWTGPLGNGECRPVNADTLRALLLETNSGLGCPLHTEPTEDERDAWGLFADALSQRLAAALVEALLEEARSTLAHMDRYLNRDATTMEVFLFVEERIDELTRQLGV